ncbi:MAG: hypothetical protein Q8873_05890 [Bacillota bacterium]|nr:hypothetical protein [Bacillota bacterium]
MNIEEIIKDTENNEDVNEDFLTENMRFILSCAGKAAKRPVNESDVEFSVALEAFKDAISHYNSFGGNFSHFAAAVINKRVLEYCRAKNPPASSFPDTFYNSPPSKKEPSQKPPDTHKFGCHDISYEISDLSDKLGKLGISFSEIAKECPKSKKARKECMRAVNYILGDKSLTSKVKRGKMPASGLCLYAGIKSQVLERYGKYIIAAVIIIDGGYSTMSDCFKLIGGEKNELCRC